MFPFDIFGFISGIFILIFVVVIIVVIIVIIVVYKLLHSNVDHEEKMAYKLPRLHAESAGIGSVKIDNSKLTKEMIIRKCKFCGEKIEDDVGFCPFCGSNLSE